LTLSGLAGDDGAGDITTRLRFIRPHADHGGSTRCNCGAHKTDDRTNRMLGEITLGGETPQWRQWLKGN